MTEKLLTPNDIRLQIGLSRVSQWRLRENGQLGFYQINGRIKYSQNHIDKYLKGCERNPQNLQANKMTWTLPEIVKTFGLSLELLNAEVKAGSLRTISIEEEVLVKRSDLLDFINSDDVSRQIG